VANTFWVRAQAVAERRAQAVARIGQDAAEANAGGAYAVDLFERDLGLGERRARRLRHASGGAPPKVVGPRLWQE
jgi:hypothetical protein